MIEWPSGLPRRGCYPPDVLQQESQPPWATAFIRPHVEGLSKGGACEGSALTSSQLGGRLAQLCTALAGVTVPGPLRVRQWVAPVSACNTVGLQRSSTHKCYNACYLCLGGNAAVWPAAQPAPCVLELDR
jgi:hypothetical protein